MEKGLEKKYGLITAICMVVGIVIGSGVFFKAEKILTATGGNLPTAILAWIIGAFIMIICAYTFSVMAAKYEKVNGIVDYAEVTLGKNYAYFFGWFMSIIYYPTLTSVLAWVCARYTCVLAGIQDITSGTCMTIACFYLCASYAVNELSPRLAGKFQVATTIIKLIPLFLMAILGTIIGIKSGTLTSNFSNVPSIENIILVKPDYTPVPNALFTAIVAASFAYEGWIIATSINSELKNGKKNLPIALVGGTFIIAIIYILYYIGLAGAADNITMISSGENGAKIAFSNILGPKGSEILMVFIVISCLGTLNGLMLACVRGIYSISARNEGPNPKLFSSIDSSTGMPTNAGILGLLLCGIWFLYFYGSSLSAKSWFGPLTFDQSELPIITIYAMYIPIFIMIIKKEKSFSILQRYIAPFLSICGSIFMCCAAFIAHGYKAVFGYITIYIIIMIIGAIFKGNKNKAL